MMLYPNVIINKTVENKNPKNTYRVIIKISHGDVDTEVTEECDYSASLYQHMLKFLTYLEYTKNYLNSHGSEFKDCYKYMCEAMGATGKECDNIHDFLISYPGYDIIFEGSNYLASIEDISVIYFDDTGVQYSTDVVWPSK